MSRAKQRGSLKSQIATAKAYSAKQTKELAQAWELVGAKQRHIARLESRLAETYTADVQDLVRAATWLLEAYEQDCAEGASLPYVDGSPGARFIDVARKIAKAHADAER